MEKSIFSEIAFLVLGGMSIIMAVMGMAIYALNVSRRRIAETEREKARMALEEQGNLLQATIEGSELARKKMAEELHDQINAQLTVVRMNLAQQGQVNSSLVETLDQAIQDVRSMSRDLMPPVLERYGLLEALDDFFDRVESQSGLQIEFEAPEPLEKSIQRDLALYRIVQEFIQNTLKYGGAKRVEVLVECKKKGQLSLMMKDDGVGFEMEEMTEGLGTRNMKSRIEYLKGEYVFESHPGCGVSLQLTIPI